MRKVSIIHFVDIERYPPTTNFLRYLSKDVKGQLKIEVLTTGGHIPLVEIPGIEIYRFAKWRKGMRKLSRMILYLTFNLRALLRLIRFSPDVILYYETLSSGAVWFFKRFFKKKVEIYIHYHEYVSKAEYRNGMQLSRWLHEREKSLYPSTDWVSHTNADRLSLFLKDVSNCSPQFNFVLPNYPPAYWKHTQNGKIAGRIGFVYVGALSLETMYVREMAAFVSKHKEECYWDIYSSNVSEDVLAFFQSSGHENISFKGGLPYDEIPVVISKYAIGLILYKGHIPNYVYNVPNKLFEYHVCGLDVWLPTSMKSALEFVTTGSYPKIMAVDFNHLDKINLAQAVDRAGLAKLQQDYFCENVFKPLVEKLTNGNAA